MKQLSLAIIGGGVAGLTFAIKASQLLSFKVKIFEKEDYFGGRAMSKQIEKNTIADLGANIIDFQSKQQENVIREFLKDLNQQGEHQDKLLLLKQPFLIYQKQLKKGDYYKDRYYYKQGFGGLVNDLQLQLKPELFELNYEVHQLESQNGNWKLFDKNQQQYHSTFDYLVFATSGPHAVELLQRSQTKLGVDLLQLEEKLKNVEYTTQISAAFELKQAPLFSCILFKNSDVTFMSSHREKYQKNQKSIVVIQYSHQYSVQNVKKEGEELTQTLLQAIPLQMKSWVGKCISVKKWSPSLIKNKQKIDLKGFQILQKKILVVGDVCNGSSRVTGAIETSIEVFNMLKEANSSKI